jgi:hypothetical protein
MIVAVRIRRLNTEVRRAMRGSINAKAERRLKERVKSDVCASDPSAHSRQPTFPHSKKKKDQTLPCSSLESRVVPLHYSRFVPARAAILLQSAHKRT